MIWLISGGSLGHIIPAVSFYFFLKGRNKDVCLILEEDIWSKRVVDCIEDVCVRWVDCCPSVKKDLSGAFRSWRDVWKKLTNVYEGNEKKVERIILFGSQGCITAWVFAMRHNIPWIVCEQNVVMGGVNRLVSFGAEAIFCGLPMRRIKKGFEKKMFLTTNYPAEIMWEKMCFDFDENNSVWENATFKVLVIGGSRGARSVNRFAIELAKVIPKDVGIVHITGERDYLWVKQEYAFLGRRVNVVRYILPASDLIKNADLVISRAGAMAITDICRYGKPAVFFPYPYARRHQLENALWLAGEGGCEVIWEKERGWMGKGISLVLELLKDKERRVALGWRAGEVWKTIHSGEWWNAFGL